MRVPGLTDLIKQRHVLARTDIQTCLLAALGICCLVWLSSSIQWEGLRSLPHVGQVANSIAAEVAAGAQPVIVIAGSKGAGKSSFGRLLVNSLLNVSSAVAYLDTDLGQPEFTVPGQTPTLFVLLLQAYCACNSVGIAAAHTSVRIPAVDQSHNCSHHHQDE